MRAQTFITAFDIGEEIYLKTDSEQSLRMVFAYIVTNNSILYRCCCGREISDHFDFEMSKEKSYKPS